MRIVEGTNIGVSDFTPETKSKMWIEALDHSPIGYGRVLDAMGYTRRTTRKDRRRIPDLACIRCGALEPPTADREAYPVTLTAGLYPANPVRFYCEQGRHSFSLAELIEHHRPTKPKVRALLENIRICEPSLIRIYAAEYEKGGAIATAKDAEVAVKEILPPVHNCEARIAGLDCPSLEIGRQLSGQLYDQLPWATVSTTPTGELLDQGWHKGRLTDQERLRQTARDQHAKFAAINTLEAATADFYRAEKARLGL